jgi:hypothetical protein
MAEVEKRAQKAIEQVTQLAELVDLDVIAEKLRLVQAGDDPDLELGELAHEIAAAASRAAEWVGQFSHAARQTGGRATAGAGWLLPLGAGAAAMAVVKNGPAIARSLREVKRRAAEVPPHLPTGGRLKGLVDFSGSGVDDDRSPAARRHTDRRALRDHLRARAEHRYRRRQQFFSR